jgi:long-chain acyl-CoA synthetase
MTLFQGGSIVLLPRFDAQAVLKLMARHRVTFFAGVPTMYVALLNHPLTSDTDLSSVRYWVSGGAAMPAQVMQSFDSKCGANVLEGYGLSETSPVASFNSLERPKQVGSIGRPIWGVDFKLVAENGDEVLESGQPGEICIRGPNVMKGYLGQPEATAEAIKDGWFHTGDIATRNDDGYYFIVDRKKDMIVRGGFNVYPREVEEILYAHPAVAEAAVLGVPHEFYGEEVKAFVALRPGHELSEPDLISYCRERLAPFKCPRLVEFCAALPKGPTGKIVKRSLRRAS